MSDYSRTKDLIQQLVLSAIKKMNLVTREEFEIQTRVLQKTRQKVEQLEKQLMLQQVHVSDGDI